MTFARNTRLQGALPTGLRCLVSLLALLTLSSRVPAEDIDVYVLTGQSNSLGTTGGREPDPSPGAHPGDAATRFFWANASTRSSDPASIVLYGDSGGVITTLRPQQGDGGANRTFWGPEFGFARTLHDAGHRRVLVVKASRGGGGNSFWIRGSGHMYSHVVRTVEPAAARLRAAGDEVTVRALLYLQGESDSESEAAAAANRLADLAENLRADLPNARDMKVIVAGIAADSSNDDLVRARQRLLPTLGDSFHYFSTLDLRDQIYDGLHFGRDAKLEIGRRFAAALLAARGEEPVVESTTFDSVLREDDARTIIIEDVVPDRDGIANGPVLVQDGPFTGFAAGPEPVGLVFEGAIGRVVFADYRASVATSDIAVGPLKNGHAPDSGRAITLAFVDSLDHHRPATVSRLGLRLAATNQNDDVSVEFLAADGSPIHTSATVPRTASAALGFVARRGDDEVSLIHRVRLKTNGPVGQLWALGSFDDQAARTVDFVYSGSRTEAGVLPADANADGLVDISDAVALLVFLFVGEDVPACSSREGRTRLLDSNGDGAADVSDASYLLNHLFGPGRPPALGMRCTRIEGCEPTC